MADPAQPDSPLIVRLHNEIRAVFEGALAEGKSDDEAEAFAKEVIEKAIPRILTSTIADLDGARAPMLKAERAIQARFERRNRRRWDQSFGLVEVVIQIAEEVGSSFNEHHRPAAALEKDYVFEAIVRLHARSLLIAREALCLCKGGFADGALSRWRSLHECRAMAAFVLIGGQDTAYRYLASFVCAALKAARELNIVVGQPGYDLGFSDDEVAAMEANVDAICARLGPEMRNDYGWAAKQLGRAKPTFADIEKAAGLAHERPRYRWASQHTHASSRPPNRLLGTVETSDLIHLTGPSNSGMVDPLQFIAIALADITKTLFSARPTIDGTVYGAIIDYYAGQVGITAVDEEKRSLARAKRQMDRAI